MLWFTSSTENVSWYLDSATAWLASWMFVMWRTEAWRTVLLGLPNREPFLLGVNERFLLVDGGTIGAAFKAAKAGLGEDDDLETTDSDVAAPGGRAEDETSMGAGEGAWTFGEEGGDPGVDDGVSWIIGGFGDFVAPSFVEFVWFIVPPLPSPPSVPLPLVPLSTPRVEFGVIGADGIVPWVDVVNAGEGRMLFGWNSSSCPDIINTPFPTIPTSSSNCT